MIMVLMSEYMLIVGMFIIPFNLFNETTFDEKGECSVYGSLGDLGAFVPESQMQFVHIEMAMNLENLLQNLLPFRSAP